MTNAPISPSSSRTRLALAVCVAVLAACSSSKNASPDADPSPDGNQTADTGPDPDAISSPCQVNADCVGSDLDKATANVRCVGRDLYCLDGTCHFECRKPCDQVRTDVNPCAPSWLCAPLPTFGTTLCTIKPVACTAVADCPAYLPSADGGTAAWTCVDGVCRYPGFDYATK